MKHLLPLLAAILVSTIAYGSVLAAPQIGKAAIEAGLIAAPSNYDIYK